jgi:hypothetical protein
MLLMDGACAAARMLGPRNQAASTGTAARTLLDAHLPHTSSSSRGQRARSPSLARHVPGEAAEAHFLCTSGRTSTAPIRAAGTRAAISIASSSPRPQKATSRRAPRGGQQAGRSASRRSRPGVVRADALFKTPDIVLLVDGDDIAVGSWTQIRKSPAGSTRRAAPAARAAEHATVGGALRALSAAASRRARRLSSP